MALSKITNLSITDDTIVNADIKTSAAIALSKLATDPSNASNLASGTFVAIARWRNRCGNYKSLLLDGICGRYAG